jgi:hypothetical protein
MFKLKTPIYGCLENSSRGWIQTLDLTDDVQSS